MTSSTEKVSWTTRLHHWWHNATKNKNPPVVESNPAIKRESSTKRAEDSKPDYDRSKSWIPPTPNADSITTASFKTTAHRSIRRRVMQKVHEVAPRFNGTLDEHYKIGGNSVKSSEASTTREPLFLSCNVQNDAQDVVFFWTKDGVELKDQDRVKVFSQETATQLRVENPQISDAGLYTCIAQSPYGSCKTQCHVEYSVGESTVPKVSPPGTDGVDSKLEFEDVTSLPECDQPDPQVKRTNINRSNTWTTRNKMYHSARFIREIGSSGETKMPEDIENTKSHTPSSVKRDFPKQKILSASTRPKSSQIQNKPQTSWSTKPHFSSSMDSPGSHTTRPQIKDCGSSSATKQVRKQNAPLIEISVPKVMLTKQEESPYSRIRSNSATDRYRPAQGHALRPVTLPRPLGNSVILRKPTPRPSVSQMVARFEGLMRPGDDDVSAISPTTTTISYLSDDPEGSPFVRSRSAHYPIGAPEYIKKTTTPVSEAVVEEIENQFHNQPDIINTPQTVISEVIIPTHGILGNYRSKRHSTSGKFEESNTPSLERKSVTIEKSDFRIVPTIIISTTEFERNDRGTETMPSGKPAKSFIETKNVEYNPLMAYITEKVKIERRLSNQERPKTLERSHKLYSSLPNENKQNHSATLPYPGKLDSPGFRRILAIDKRSPVRRISTPTKVFSDESIATIDIQRARVTSDITLEMTNHCFGSIPSPDPRLTHSSSGGDLIKRHVADLAEAKVTNREIPTEEKIILLQTTPEAVESNRFEFPSDIMQINESFTKRSDHTEPSTDASSEGVQQPKERSETYVTHRVNSPSESDTLRSDNTSEDWRKSTKLNYDILSGSTYPHVPVGQSNEGETTPTPHRRNRRDTRTLSGSEEKIKLPTVPSLPTSEGSREEETFTIKRRPPISNLIPSTSQSQVNTSTLPDKVVLKKESIRSSTDRGDDASTTQWRNPGWDAYLKRIDDEILAQCNQHVEYPSKVETKKGIDPNTDYAPLSSIQMLGEGKFGKVRTCVCRESSALYALKTFRMNRLTRHHGELMEIAVLRAVGKHPQIAHMVAAYEFRVNAYIVNELVPGGALYDRIREGGYLNESITVKIVRQLLCGLEHLKTCRIIHCDLKPENVIMCKPEGYELKLIDFGLACFYDPPQAPRKPAGTLTYWAPETQNYDAQSYATDLWSLAVITYEILSGITPFEIPADGDLDRKLTPDEISRNITKVRYSFEEEGIEDASDEVKAFIKRILIRDPTKRPTVEECLKDTWVTLPDGKRPQMKRTISLRRHVSHMVTKPAVDNLFRTGSLNKKIQNGAF